MARMHRAVPLHRGVTEGRRRAPERAAGGLR